MSTVTELNDSNFEQQLKDHKIAIVDVFASWCGSCRLFAPTFNAVAAEFSNYSFYKIDGEKNPKFAGTVSIDNLPFVAVFHNGEYVGGQSTTKRETLLEMINTIKAKVGSTENGGA